MVEHGYKVQMSMQVECIKMKPSHPCTTCQISSCESAQKSGESGGWCGPICTGLLVDLFFSYNVLIEEINK